MPRTKPILLSSSESCEKGYINLFYIPDKSNNKIFTVKCSIDYTRNQYADFCSYCFNPSEIKRAMEEEIKITTFTSIDEIGAFFDKHIKDKIALQDITVSKLSDYVKYTNLEYYSGSYYKLKMITSNHLGIDSLTKVEESYDSLWRQGDMSYICQYLLKKPSYMLYSSRGLLPPDSKAVKYPEGIDSKDVSKLYHPDSYIDEGLKPLHKVKLNYIYKDIVNDLKAYHLEEIKTLPQSQYILNLSIRGYNGSLNGFAVDVHRTFNTEPDYILYDAQEMSFGMNKGPKVSDGETVKIYPPKYFRESIKYTISLNLIDISIIEDIMNIIFTPEAKNNFRRFCYSHFISFKKADSRLDDVYQMVCTVTKSESSIGYEPIGGGAIDGLATHYIKELCKWLGPRIPISFVYTDSDNIDSVSRKQSIVTMIDNINYSNIYNEYIFESFNCWKDNNRQLLYEQMGVAHPETIPYPPTFNHRDLVSSDFAMHLLKWIGQYK